MSPGHQHGVPKGNAVIFCDILDVISSVSRSSKMHQNRWLLELRPQTLLEELTGVVIVLLVHMLRTTLASCML